MSDDLTRVPNETLLAWLRDARKERVGHKLRARTWLARWRTRCALGEYTSSTLLGLMRAQEASRGSRIRARRLHEEWVRRIAAKRIARCVREGWLTEAFGGGE